MYLFLLRKALPFTLTFIFGAALSGLVGLFGHSEKKAESWTFTRTYEYGGHCRMRRHNLVAESKPLVILDVPAARWPKDLNRDLPWSGNIAKDYMFPGAEVRVTFGADGKVQRVEPSDEPHPSLGPKGDKVIWECMARAAWQIQFEPETIDGVPVTVTKDVDIPFTKD
jgi:hypothetical protein